MSLVGLAVPTIFGVSDLRTVLVGTAHPTIANTTDPAPGS